MVRAFDRVRNYDDYEEALRMALPHSPQTERELLGHFLIDPNLIITARKLGLEPVDMYVVAHNFTLAAMYLLTEARKVVNPLTLAEQLRADGRIEQVGGLSYISELSYGLPHYMDEKTLGQYIETIQNKAHMREMLKTVNLIAARILEGAETMEEIFGDAETTVGLVVAQALRGTRQKRRGFVIASDERPNIIETFRQLHKGVAMALPTGLKPFDRLLSGAGLKGKGVYLFAARPKTGKTALCLSMAHRIARRGTQVAYLTLEMSREELILRLYSAFTGIPYFKLVQPGLHGTDYEVALASAEAFFEGLGLHVADDIYSLDDLWREGERLVNAGVGVIFLDYIQLMALKRGQVLDPNNRAGEVSVVSREVKRMAQMWNIPIAAISSLNREVTAGLRNGVRGAKQVIRPELWHLRESGQLEFDAEAITFLFNPDLYVGISDADRATLNTQRVWNIVLDLAAQRNGPIDEVPLKFIRDRMDFMTPEEYARATTRPVGEIPF
jgi:replicative DNA helicase